MKKFLFYLAFGCVCLYFLLPYVGQMVHHHQANSRANWKKKILVVDRDIFSYRENEKKGPTIVFVHGVQSDTSYWSYYAEKLKDQYHIIAINLPGHGDSSVSDEHKFDIVSMAKTVDRFIEKKGLDSFHLVGASFGGGVATTYAATYPDKVKSLVILNPFAVLPPQKSEAYAMLENGRNPFFPQNLEELDDLYRLFIGKALPVHPIFKRQILLSMKQNYPLYERAINEMLSGPLLEQSLPKLTLPTLIFIGENDQILDGSSSEVFEQYMPNGTVKVIPGGTHVFIGKAFVEVSDEMKAFIDQQS